MPERKAARLIVINPENRVLLFYIDEPKIVRPSVGKSEIFWCTPGGGVDPGETFEEAAVRELKEETGITGVALGPCVATAGPTPFVLNGKLFDCIDRFYLVRISNVEISFDGMYDYELETTLDHRWWSVDELRATTDRIAPDRVADLVEMIIAGQLPDEPIRI